MNLRLNQLALLSPLFVCFKAMRKWSSIMIGAIKYKSMPNGEINGILY